MTTPNTAVTTATAPKSQKASALNVMASKFSVEPAKLLETLKHTVFKGATDNEMLALVVVANTYGLNPLLKEIYAFPAKGGGIVPVVSVDGWIRMCNDHPQFDGMDFSENHDSKGELISVTCRIFRKDRSHPIVITEYLAECRRNTEPWKMVNRMMRHKSLIQCARVAFGFSGIQDEDEANDTVMRTAGGRVVNENPLANPYKAVETRESFSDLPESGPKDEPGGFVEAPDSDPAHDAPEPEPEQTPEPEPAPAPVDEHKELVGIIRDFLLEQDVKMTVFAPACRKAGLLADRVQLIDLPADALRVIAENRLAILNGTFAQTHAPGANE